MSSIPSDSFSSDSSFKFTSYPIFDTSEDSSQTYEDDRVEKLEDVKKNYDFGYFFTWKCCSAFFALLSIILWISLVVFIILYVNERSKHENNSLEDHGSSFVSRLSGMNMYSFSNRQGEKINEGILFLPGDEVSYFYENEESKISTTIFRTDHPKYPVSWMCTSKSCQEQYNQQQVFDLVSINKPSAISFFQNWIEKNEEFSDAPTCDQEEYDCYPMGGEEYYYRCSAKPVVEWDNIKSYFKSMINLFDLTPPIGYCYETIEDYDLTQIVGCSNEYFTSVVDHFNEKYSYIAYEDKNPVNEITFHGCEEMEGKIEDQLAVEDEIDFCCGKDHGFKWGDEKNR